MPRHKSEIKEEEDLQSIISGLKETLGSESMDIYGKSNWYLHTGNLALDYIISGKVDGTGGYPSGKIVEIFGPSGTGKSLLLALAGANMQKIGGIFVLEDAEKRWDAEFASMHGVNANDVVSITVDTVEDFTVKTMELLERALKNNPVPKLLIVVDSIAAMSTLKEIDDAGTKADQGRRAQRIHAAMRVLPGKVYEAEAIMLVTNHVVDNVGVMYGPKKITPGGSGMTFHSSTRIETKPTSMLVLEGKKRPIGVTMHAKCAKSSVTIPFGECMFDLTWAGGVSPYSGLLELMEDMDIIEEAGSWYKYKDNNFRGKEVDKFIQEHPEILKDPKWESPYFKVGV